MSFPEIPISPLRSPPPRAPHSHHHHHDHNHDDQDATHDEEIELPGLAELPQLIQRAVQRQADKYKGKRPQEIMSASQWRAANKHNEGIKAKNRKPPKNLVTTDGIHFFSSIRVLDFFESTKNNLVKQQAQVLNRAQTFNERDMNTFTQLWEEKALLDGDIDKLRDEVIMRSRKLDCDCNLNRHVNHLRATRTRTKLRKKLRQKDVKEANQFENKRLEHEAAEESYRIFKASYSEFSTERPMSPPMKLPPPTGLLQLPRCVNLYTLKQRKQPPAPLCSFISTDVLLVDTKVIQYLVRVFQEAVDMVNNIADQREEKAKQEEDERRKKREELLKLAKAAEEAAMVSSSEEDEDEDEDENDKVEEIIEHKIVSAPGFWYTGEIDVEVVVVTTLKNVQDLENINEKEKNNAIMEKESSESEEDGLYQFSEHSSDFADEFEEEIYGTTKMNIHGPGLDDDENDYITSLMEGAIVRMHEQLVPPTWLKFISEALELIPVELRSRGARFVDLTGSTGATSILTALWSLGWISLVTYETNYENLVLAKFYKTSVQQIIRGLNFDGEKEENDSDASDSDSSGSSSDSSDSDDNNDDNDPVARGKRLLAQQRKTKKTKMKIETKNININIIDPKSLPLSYQEKKILDRLSCVESMKKDWDWDSDDPWVPGPWSNASIVLINENVLQHHAPFGCAVELHSIIQTEQWREKNYEDDLILNLAKSFIGKEKMYSGNSGDGLLSIGAMESLLEEMDKLEDDRINDIVKISDRETWEYYALKKNLARRQNVADRLLKLKDDTLIIVIQPERDVVVIENEDNEENETEDLPLDDRVDRHASEHGDNDDPDINGIDQEEEEENANKKKKINSGNGNENINDKLSIVPAAKSNQSNQQHKVKQKPKRRQSSFALTYGTNEEEADLLTWTKPTVESREILRKRWLDEKLFEPNNIHFEHIQDNFVFRNMVKQPLWNGGAPISAILYRRVQRSLLVLED